MKRHHCFDTHLCPEIIGSLSGWRADEQTGADRRPCHGQIRCPRASWGSSSGGSYLSQSDLRLHFGLGKETKIDAVEILWPGGRKAGSQRCSGRQHHHDSRTSIKKSGPPKGAALKFTTDRSDYQRRRMENAMWRSVLAIVFSTRPKLPFPPANVASDRLAFGLSNCGVLARL